MPTIPFLVDHVDCQGHKLRGNRRRVHRKGHDIMVDRLGRVTLRVNEKIGKRDWDAIVAKVADMRERLRSTPAAD